MQLWQNGKGGRHMNGQVWGNSSFMYLRTGCIKVIQSSWLLRIYHKLFFFPSQGQSSGTMN